MDVIVYLIPIALFMGALGLAAFIWSTRTGQLDDMDGAAMRALRDDDGTISSKSEAPTHRD